MNETTQSLPYIDLGNEPSVLIQYAKDHFGVRIAANAKPETVVAKFRELYKDATGTVLPDVAPLDDDFEDDEQEDEKVAAKKEKPVPTHVTINIQEDEKDKHPVCGSVQFVPYRIMRNVNVKVRYQIYQSLKDAVKTVLDTATMEKKDVPAYPFSVVEFHFDD